VFIGFIGTLYRMKTIVQKVGTDEEIKSAAFEAAQFIRSGEIVAFPTETVYGLGADAGNADAVAKIFTAKDRPADNPLIVHIHDIAQLDDVVANIPPTAARLMEKFWPGPLSLVLPKKDTVPDITTAGLDTVVVRMPNHPVAQAIIRASGVPIAAPSANRSGRVSPTCAEHVLADLDGRIPLIIDGGPTVFGLESTVVDCTTEPLVILRPGSITYDMLKLVVPDILNATDQHPQRSPGMKYRHYSPNAPVILFTGPTEKTARAIIDYVSSHQNLSLAIVAHSHITVSPNVQTCILSSQTDIAAPQLFSALRSLDQLHPTEILVQGYQTNGVGAAIMNRLEKAATTIINC
jgi:L-threonylcarbamoyladenylate synthase